MSVIVSIIKFVVSYILPPVALFVAYQSRMDSKRAVAAAEKSAEEAKNSRKVAEREVDLPHLIEVKRFLGELGKVTDTVSREIKVEDLKNVGKSLDYLLHLGDRFSFLKPISSIIDGLLSYYRNNPDDYRVYLGNTQSTKVSSLNQIGLKNIIAELEKIKFGV
ncbi:MAG: hypothetical protein V4694_01010 [Pseudomonadota bacterium]